MKIKPELRRETKLDENVGKIVLAFDDEGVLGLRYIWHKSEREKRCISIDGERTADQVAPHIFYPLDSAHVEFDIKSLLATKADYPNDGELLISDNGVFLRARCTDYSHYLVNLDAGSAVEQLPSRQQNQPTGLAVAHWRIRLPKGDGQYEVIYDSLEARKDRQE